MNLGLSTGCQEQTVHWGTCVKRRRRKVQLTPLIEDAHGDIIGLPDAAPSSSRAADVPTSSRTAVCSCPHGSKAAECPVCQAADRRRVLKLMLGKKAFEVMVTGEKTRNFVFLRLWMPKGMLHPRMETVRGCSLACANRAGGGCCTMICRVQGYMTT